MNLDRPGIIARRRIIDDFVRAIVYYATADAIELDPWDIQRHAVACADRGMIPRMVKVTLC
jgi:hypothetical protein